MNLLELLALIAFPTLDRIGGAFYKPARRFGIPLLLLAFYSDAIALISAAIFAFILSFNLDEIEDRNWEEIALWSFTFYFCLQPFAGFYAALPAIWWPLGIYLSNYGIRERKLDWQYVELLRGFLIALAVVLQGHYAA